MKTNLLKYRDRLSNSDFQEIAKLQSAVRKKGGEAVRGLMTDRDIVDATIKPLFPRADLRGKEAEELTLMRREIDVMIRERKRRTGKDELQPEDVQKIADAAVLRRVFRSGDLGVDKRNNAKYKYLTTTSGEHDGVRQAYVPTEHIPQAERTAIAKYLRSRGQTVSTSKIERMYAAMLLENRALMDEIAAESRNPEDPYAVREQVIKNLGAVENPSVPQLLSAAQMVKSARQRQAAIEAEAGPLPHGHVVDEILRPLFPKAGAGGEFSRSTGEAWKQEQARAALRQEIDEALRAEQRRTGKELDHDAIGQVTNSVVQRYRSRNP
jgi:hypothetical protein